jgi:hypothetical protein
MHAYLDTHVVVRLSSGDTKGLTGAAKKAIDRYDLLVSPIGRSKTGGDQILGYLEEKLDLRICEIPFDRVARASCRETWTRDTFDRMIVAHARCAGDAYLISADGDIGANYPFTIW